MNNTENITKAIIDQGMLPLYFNADETVSTEILRSLYEGGVRVLEYTNRGEAAKANFKKMVEVRNGELPGMLLGVGTIKNIRTATVSYTHLDVYKRQRHMCMAPYLLLMADGWGDKTR